MKHVLRYNCFTIPDKLRGDIRISFDDNRTPELSSVWEGNDMYNVNLFPLFSLGIIRKTELNDEGVYQKAPWNPNDNLGMTKYNLPIFLKELLGIQKDLEIPELYTYHGNRLELNEEIASKIRRPFMVGNTTVELSAVIITQMDDTRVEGIKIKFNNEQSSVMLTLNDLTSLVYNLEKLNMDNLALQIYSSFKNKKDLKEIPQNNSVDILPKMNSFT